MLTTQSPQIEPGTKLVPGTIVAPLVTVTLYTEHGGIAVGLGVRVGLIVRVEVVVCVMGVGVCVEVAVGGVPVTVAVGVGLVHEGKRNDPIRVFQPELLVVCMYSWVYQKVQSSTGST